MNYYEVVKGTERVMSSNIELILGDCMPGMHNTPDKFFDLAIVDPPYGLNMAKERPRKDGRFAHNKPRTWDENIPSPNYFNELNRVSQNQIIWGGNYFGLPPTQGFIFWYKQNPVDNFSDGEYAWTSFQIPAKCFPFRYYGNLEGHTSAPDKIHISQKPIDLYRWILKHYAKEGNKILDTHLGSGSIAIACYDMGFDLTGYEIDQDYYNAAVKRFENHKKQLTLY
jgi:site-specific DNA-methyltransferase (adenine-specific)